MEHKRECTICNNTFTTKYPRTQVCSFLCKQVKQRDNSRRIMRLKREKKSCDPCQICGFDLTTDQHHEGKDRYILCPNHHALITRGKKTIEEVLAMKTV